ncbi:ISL3 family transposase [Fructilactobacillus frigidiflavus]|uniref:ISL3 family transposase n=1 Tax=Fructilactobacillus frigidiflavus TaxID=3242688 RepID=UPI003757EF95
MNNDITMQMFGISDPNISYDDTTEKYKIVKSNGTTKAIWNLKLTYSKNCDKCGILMNKNGFKKVSHKGPVTAVGLAIINIKKQKYICKLCKNTAIASLNDINKSDHILRLVKVNAALDYGTSSSVKDIAKRYEISANTVMRQAKKLSAYHKIGYHYLPKNIAFDDFKSDKMAPSGMSMMFINSDSLQPIDVIQSRKGSYLESYFIRYTSSARRAVRTVTVDLFSPYRGIINRVFPNAAIIADRFHVVNIAKVALNQERIKLMKHFGSGTPEYRQLKSLHKLLFKKEDELDYTHFKPRRNFKWASLTDKEVVNRLLSISSSLRDAYEYYQELDYIVTKSHNQKALNDLLDSNTSNKQYPNLPKLMKKARKTLKKHKEEIINSFKYNYSNGPLEGMNNKVKTINRIAYGYRNFFNFRLRILVSFSRTYFAMTYNQKATKSLKNSVA